jgi:Mrp family chromosome partitioning ATPase
MTETTRHSRPATLLRVHAWLIVTAVAVTIGSASAVALTRPSSYVATAQVSVAPEQAGGTALRPEMASERAIATSGTVTANAADVLGRDPREAERGLAVSVVIESSILNIRYTAATGAAAVAGARAFAQSYVDYRNNVAGMRIARVVTWPNTVKASGVNLSLILGLALVAGLVLGVGAAWTWDRVADRLRDSDELTDHSGLPVLGEIPRWSAPGHLAPLGPAREAFAYVSARLGALGSQRHVDLRIVVTSPRAGAGTTTIALTTALAFAAQERDVVLVGADPRQSGLHDLVEVPGAPGLVEVLDAECTLESALRRTRWPNLSVLTVGGTSHTDDVRLQPDMLALVLDQLSARAIVIVDAPPILEAADSLVLVDRADVLLLVGDLRSGRRGDVERVMRLIEQTRPVVAGWVANVPRRTASPGPERLTAEPRAIAESSRKTADRSDRVAS